MKRYKLNFMRIFFFLITVFALNSYTFSQSIEGKWITIDEKTDKEKSVVEIYEKDGKFFGKIVEFLEEGANPDDACEHCKGEMKGKKLMGYDVLKNFEKDGKKYKNGTVTDPENDKTYDAKIWVDEKDSSILNLRAYVAMVYKTIQWKRVPN